MFHFESTKDSKGINISVNSIMYVAFKYAYDNVTDFEMCEFHKNIKI